MDIRMGELFLLLESNRSRGGVATFQQRNVLRFCIGKGAFEHAY